jgi:hypothetical protein
VLAAGVLFLASADPTNRAQALFNKLFYQIGVAPGGAGYLRELGVRPEEMRYIGVHSFVPGSPAADRAWVESFYTRTTYSRLAGWYLRHPRIVLSTLWYVLTVDGPEFRQTNLSNFRRQDKRPPSALSDRFALWSGLRIWLLKRWPWHMPLWYTLFISATIAVLRSPRSAAERRLAWLAFAVAAFGLGQFGVAALADCLETGRHLFLFQVLTDVTICFAAAWLASRIPWRSAAR